MYYVIKIYLNLFKSGVITSKQVEFKNYNNDYTSLEEVQNDIDSLLTPLLQTEPQLRPAINLISENLQKVLNSSQKNAKFSKIPKNYFGIVANQCAELIDSLCSYIDENTGRELVQEFMILPSHTKFPQYYEDIMFPISLSNIRPRIKKQKYTNIIELLNDVAICFQNSQIFNREDSQIFKNSILLYNLFAKLFADKLQQFDQVHYIYYIGSGQRHFFPKINQKDPDMSQTSILSENSMLSSPETMTA